MRFPARKPAPVSRAPARDGVEAGAEAGSTRPITLYLADLNPHLVAAAPTAPIARSRYYNGVSFYEGRLDEDEGAGCEGLEMREVELREPAPRAGSRAYLAGSDAQSVTVSGDGDGRDVEGQGGMRTKGEEVRARNRNCLIGWVFILALVIAIVVFAVFIYLANRPRGVAG